MGAHYCECVGGSAYYPAEWKTCNTNRKPKNALHCECVDVLSNYMYSVTQMLSHTHHKNNDTLHYVKTCVASNMLAAQWLITHIAPIRSFNPTPICISFLSSWLVIHIICIFFCFYVTILWFMDVSVWTQLLQLQEQTQSGKRQEQLFSHELYGKILSSCKTVLCRNKMACVCLNTLRTGHLNCLNAWFPGFKPFNPLDILCFFKNL